MYARLQSVPPPSSIEGRWQYFVGTLFADPETALSLPGLPGHAEGVVYEDVNGSYQRESWEPDCSVGPSSRMSRRMAAATAGFPRPGWRPTRPRRSRISR